MSTEPPETPELPSIAFDVDELGLLAIRAKAVIYDGPNDPELEKAFDDLAHQLIVVQALIIRANVLHSPAPPPGDHVDASETPEAIAAEVEEEEPVEGPPEPPENVVFKVRPKSAERWCSMCGTRQWKSPGGWVCDHGHGGAGRVHIPACPECTKPMEPQIDKETGSLLALRCECGAYQPFSEIADPDG
jgi:hypothetical protein